MTDAGAAPKVKTGKAGPSGGEVGEKKRFEVKKVNSSGFPHNIYVYLNGDTNL